MSTLVNEGNRIVDSLVKILASIPYSVVALLGRVGVASVFWQAGQTKVDNFTVSLVPTVFDVGIPSIADSALYLFKFEYDLPILAPFWAAVTAALVEHICAAMLLLGVGTRLAAFLLFVEVMVIQFLVYPDAWPLHASWVALLLMLMANGAGAISLDGVLKRR